MNGKTGVPLAGCRENATDINLHDCFTAIKKTKHTYQWASLVEVISNRFFSLVFNVHKMFFEVDVKGVPSFTDAELSTSGAMNDICSIVCQAVELFHDVHLGLRTSNVGVGADERTCSTFCLIAWSGPWCSCGWLMQLRLHQHATDVCITFVCNHWWLTEDLCYFGMWLQDSNLTGWFCVHGWWTGYELYEWTKLVILTTVLSICELFLFKVCTVHSILTSIAVAAAQNRICQIFDF